MIAISHNTYLSTLVFALALFMLSAAPALAASTITVDWEETPLFKDSNVMPGDSVTRTVTITNNSSAEEALYISVTDTFNTGLGDVMELVIERAGVTYFDDVFTNFFSATPIELAPVPPGASHTYELTAALDSGTGNLYQTSQLGFTLILGFTGGDSTTDTNGGTGGGGGGGGTSGGTGLVISNEAATVDGDRGTISWTTNLSATSFVVCGETSFGPFTLNNDVQTNFGYDFVLPENTSLTDVHSMETSSLEPGTYECRPASRRTTSDRFTVGRTVTFTIEESPEGLILGEQVTTPSTPSTQPTVVPAGSVFGKSKSDMGGLTYDEWRAERDQAAEERANGADGAADENGSPTSSPTTLNDAEPTVAGAFVERMVDEPLRTSAMVLGGLLAILLGVLASRRYFIR